MTERLFIEGTTSASRHEMITRIERAISHSGGWMLDHRFFSNVAVSLSFEIGAEKIGAMREALEATGLKLTPRSREELARRATVLTPPVEQITGFLHVTFLHNEPDLKQEIPAIPG